MEVTKIENGKMVYSIYSADERAKCPVCGKTTEMFYMDEERKYINPVTKKESTTHAGCKIYDYACFSCQKAKTSKVG